MKTALDKKLDKLKKKKDALTEEIQQIENEKAHELRKIKDKKRRLIGQTIAECLEQEESIVLRDKQDLLRLLDKHLRRKSDRTVFGLKPLLVEKNTKAENSDNSPLQEELLRP